MAGMVEVSGTGEATSRRVRPDCRVSVPEQAGADARVRVDADAGRPGAVQVQR